MKEVNAARNLLVAVWVFGIFILIGWIMNIIELIAMIGEGVTTLFIVRVVGVFAAPLGSILGWFF